VVEHIHGKDGVPGSNPGLGSMATKKPFLKLQCQDCKRVNYYTRKSKQVGEKKLELKKFCKQCRKHTVHKESKK
jgi:large subunit ribosomal protein L33